MRNRLFFVLVCVFGVLSGMRDAYAGSCVNPAHLVTHFESCLEEFSECFEGYDDAWDAMWHTDDIVECIVNYVEAEAEEAVATAVMIITNDNEAAEEAVTSVLEKIFGVDDEFFDWHDEVFDDVKEDLKGLVENVIEKRQGAREELKEFIKKLIEKRNDMREKFRGRMNDRKEDSKSEKHAGPSTRANPSLQNSEANFLPADSDETKESAEKSEYDLRYGEQNDYWYGS